MPVSTDNFWQTWTFKTRTGALAFNHTDGTLRMVRQPDGNELVAPASPLVPAVAGFSLQSAEILADPHDRVLAVDVQRFIRSQSARAFSHSYVPKLLRIQP
jgi:hypothetical protein